MKIGIMPDFLTGEIKRFRQLEAMAKSTEAAGLDSFWLVDHLLMRLPGREPIGFWEVFTTLSALATATTRISLGPLVTCISFRSPGLLAKVADSLDEISGGRFVLGLGCGWHRPEYEAFGYPFSNRVRRFEEALQIVVPLLRRGKVSFDGIDYHVADAEVRPRGPSSAGPSIWIGADRPNMLRLTALHADAWNTAWHLSPSSLSDLRVAMQEACVQVGRDPATLACTVGTSVRVLTPNEREDPGIYAIQGSPDAIADALHGFAHAGVEHLIVVVRGIDELEAIERFAHSVALFRRG